MSEQKPYARLAFVSAGLILAAAISVSLLRFFGQVPPGQNLEAAVGALAFGAVIAAPAVLALLAVRRQEPALLLPAAVLLVPLSFISFALVTLPLLIPAYLLLRAYSRSASGEPVWRSIVYTASTFTILAAAFLALFVHQDPREWSTTNGGYGTSDIITFGEAAISLALTGAAIALGALVRIGRDVPRTSAHGEDRAGNQVGPEGSQDRQVEQTGGGHDRGVVPLA